MVCLVDTVFRLHFYLRLLFYKSGMQIEVSKVLSFLLKRQKSIFIKMGIVLGYASYCDVISKQYIDFLP